MRECGRSRVPLLNPISSSTKAAVPTTANLRIKILGVKGFDSSIILDLRGGILMSKGNSLEVLSQAVLAGIILVGRLGVLESMVICLFVV